MLHTQREEQILQQLQLCANIKAADLAKSMEVSLDTVRRDLKAMDAAGLVKYVRGGACLPESLAAISQFSGREIIHIEQKRKAAIKALKYIHPGSLIALNSGTTNTILAQEIIKRYTDLTVVTNNLAAAAVLMHNACIHTIIVGGDLDAGERSTCGHTCEVEFARYTTDCAFLSINAVDEAAGYTDFRYAEIGVMQTLVQHTKKAVAVMDSSKFDRRSKKQVFGLKSVAVLVTDEIPDDVKAVYTQAGVVVE